MLTPSSICGVTSSEMPEKNGVSVSEGSVVPPVEPSSDYEATVPPVMPVTKKSSDPTFRIAF